MRKESFSVPLEKNPSISMKVTPGHFATSHFHITHYLDLSDLKTNASLARDVARELALPYLSSTLVDTIVCLEGTEVIGAYMAEELMQDGTAVINSGQEIHVITPMSNIHKKLMFQSNVQESIINKNIILLISSISSGVTISAALECVSYYGGIVVGISALFNGYKEKLEQEIHAMFTLEDIPEYQGFLPGECQMCKQGDKLDAIILYDGYINI